MESKKYRMVDGFNDLIARFSSASFVNVPRVRYDSIGEFRLVTRVSESLVSICNNCGIKMSRRWNDFLFVASDLALSCFHLEFINRTLFIPTTFIETRSLSMSH